MRKLVYVSNNVILSSGAQNPFFLQEKAWLAERFGEFDVICPQGWYVCDGQQLRLQKRPGAMAHLPAILCAVFDAHVYQEFSRMGRDGAMSLRNVLKVLRYAYQAAYLRPMIEAAAGKDAVVYSYWLSYDAYAVAQVKAKRPGIYAVARAHSYELQLHRNACNPYLMKAFTCGNLDKVAFVSQNSLDDFLAYYRGQQDALCVQHLGTSGKDALCVERGQENVLSIVSCSAIIPVKQLEYLISALEDWDLCPVRWTHIGAGSEEQKIKALAKEHLQANPFVEYAFAGYLDNSDVRALLRDARWSVFVNCSKSEGIPVSIMEAMSFGIPAIAPRICGIPELVVPGTGLLYEPADGAQGPKKALEAFAQHSARERQTMGEAAFMQWKKYFCLEKNLTGLFIDVDS